MVMCDGHNDICAYNYVLTHNAVEKKKRKKEKTIQSALQHYRYEDSLHVCYVWTAKLVDGCNNYNVNVDLVWLLIRRKMG